MGRIIIYPYKMKSRSASKLQEYLEEAGADCLKVYPDGKYEPRKSDLIIGWGAGDLPSWYNRYKEVKAKYLNKSPFIMRAINKMVTLDFLRDAGVSVPRFTSNRELAKSWLEDGAVVLARQETEGRDGSGLVVMSAPNQFVAAPLYTRYVAKDDEYRVHVMNGEAFWAQVRTQIEDENNEFYNDNPDSKIRISKNGWTLYVANRDCPNICKKEAIKAISALGLDFGAVDIGYHDSGEVCIYEVNTAPELSDRTCTAYTEQFLSLVG